MAIPFLPTHHNVMDRSIILHWDGIYRQNLRGRVVLGARLPPVAINDLISNDGNGLRVVSDKSVGKKEVYRK
jgi:hypothetical protein